MYTKALRKDLVCAYRCAKTAAANFLRFQYPHDSDKPQVKTAFPGAAHKKAIEESEATQAFDNQFAVRQTCFRLTFVILGPTLHQLETIKGKFLQRH